LGYRYEGLQTFTTINETMRVMISDFKYIIKIQNISLIMRKVIETTPLIVCAGIYNRICKTGFFYKNKIKRVKKIK
jgi:hypothetical protein